MRTEPGLVLEGRYELTSLIATGGMGQVWKGRDKELKREVAIKVLREEYAGDEGFLKRFRAEARHTAALSHEGIAALYDYGELDGRAYIVMELCPGRPLSDIIEENPGGLPEKRVVSLLIELARALDAAHSKGVVHRDVKPENVLVDENNGWSMKITDFGIARSKDQARLTKTGLVMGTAQYLSPEQAMGKQATSLSDIYALGIVGYEMLVGSRPFTGSSQVEIAMAQVKQQPPELPESLNADLRRLVMMMLAKAPANRPRSAAAVARILEAIQRGVEPRFTTGAIPVTRVEDHDWTGENRVRPAGSRDGSPGSPGSGGTGPQERRPGASPTGTRTAAMPLPLSGRGRGIRHRSGASGPSALSAASAGSAPRLDPVPSRHSASTRDSASSRDSARSAISPGAAPRSWPESATSARGTESPLHAASAASTADGAERAFAGGAFEDVDTASSSRTVRGTSTGRRVGGLSVPGLVLIILVVVAIAVAIAGGLGLLPLGALGATGLADGGAAAAGAALAVVGVAPPTPPEGDGASGTTMVRSVGVDHGIGVDQGTRTGVE
ncbi:serine/threonine-protein kinase [Brachybacterium aquaticum]|uniref:non-specific serine/threonine protein kinase n=1 Tax=Brachybacterium aquaticum TaxID=1432564 RepID=A0A841A8R6_9MICO|nr:serine/threonine-protein kinase [Brachybacterium aquaticum]MBB5830327.1 serine/threonine-protein kinase [Brachybacterium aquaticum]